MQIDRSLYVRAPQDYDRDRFEYHEETWILPKDLADLHCSEDKRHAATEEQADRRRQNLPGDSNEWILACIPIEGDASPIEGAVPLTYTFVFKRPRRR